MPSGKVRVKLDTVTVPVMVMVVVFSSIVPPPLVTVTSQSKIVAPPPDSILAQDAVPVAFALESAVIEFAVAVPDVDALTKDVAENVNSANNFWLVIAVFELAGWAPSYIFNAPAPPASMSAVTASIAVCCGLFANRIFAMIFYL